MRGRVVARWTDWRERVGAPLVELERVRRRLELLVAATYGRPIAIEPADAPPFEVYRNEPGETPPEALLTDICVPLEAPQVARGTSGSCGNE